MLGLAQLFIHFNPATISLGDSGSLLTGFLLGCYGALWSEKSATILGMTAPMTAVLFDYVTIHSNLLFLAQSQRQQNFRKRRR